MIAILERARLLAWLLGLALAAPCPVSAQSSGSAPPPPPSGAPAAAAAADQGPPAFTAEQLEQIAAPVALYPDPLLAQVLMASTYPLEVVQAARFAKDNPNLQGDKLDEALKEQTWDESVKSLLSFPQALSLMDQKLEWTQKLGDAFLGQQKDLMAAIQRLRARAQAEGNLKSTAEQIVTVEPTPPAPPDQAGATAPSSTIVIQPANPQVVYVPAYNPAVVYGAWPYPAYPPYYPYPPGYAFGAAALSFGIGMAVGGAVWGNCNWGGGDVDIDVNKNQNFTKNVNKPDRAADRMNRQGGQAGGRSDFKHNPENRRGVQYRDQGTQQKFNKGPGAGQQPAQSRDAFRGRAEQGRQDLSRGGDQGGARGGGQGGDAFKGMGGSGAEARNQANRGQGSRQSSMGAGGGGRGQSSISSGSRGGGGGGGGGARGGGGGGGRGGGGGGRGGGRR